VRIYFVFYILLIGIYIFKRRDDEESQKKANIRAAIFAFLGLTLLMGLKADYIGIDTGNYINKYMFAERLMQNIEKNGEYGYVYFMNFFKQICGFGWRRYIFSVALIIYACNISFFYKYSKNVALTVLIFCTIGNFTMYMSGLRQTIAISMCLVAYMILVSDLKVIIRYVLFCMIVFAATTIHQSAYIFYVVLLFYNLKVSKNMVYILIFFALGALFYRNALVEIIEKVMPIKYEIYNLYDSEYVMNKLLIVIDFLIPLLANFLSDENKDNGKYDRITSTMFIMSSLNLLFMILVQNNNQLGRLGYYFVNSNAILIPNAIKRIKSSEERSMVVYITLIICFIYFAMATDGGILHIDNYRFFWEKY